MNTSGLRRPFRQSNRSVIERRLAARPSTSGYARTKRSRNPFGPPSAACGGAQATSTIGSRRCRARTRRPRGGPYAASADQAVDGACHDGSGPAPAAFRPHPSPAPATRRPRPGCRAARAPSPLPNPADGAGRVPQCRPRHAFNERPCGSPNWHRSKCGNSSLHTRAGLSRGTQCSGSDCPVTQGRASARGLVQRRRGRITEQREPVVDPLSGQTLMGAGPLVPSPAPCA